MPTFVIVATLLVACSLAAAVPATTEPTDAASLIREVQQSELWFDHLTSFHMKLESTPTDATTGPSGYTVELAFAPNRLRRYTHSSNNDYLRLWDGQRQIDRQSAYNGPATYVILDHPQMGESFMTYLNWGRLADHHFWWIHKGEYNGAGTPTDPDDFTLAGRQTFRGTPCYVLTSQTHAITHYVGVADHRLYGTEVRATSRQDLSKITAATLAAVNAQFHQSFKTMAEIAAWRNKLPPDQRRLADRAHDKVIIFHAHPYIEQWLSDYRELAPGQWFPMKQGSRIHALDQIAEQPPSEQAVTLVELNPKLDDALFTPAPIPDGARVDDMIHNISYKQKEDRTPVEWQQLLNERATRDAEAKAYVDAQNALVGKPAPAFPKDATWINAPKPLAWSDLKGKVVLVGFFADWCGPCRDELPHLADLHKQSKETGITVLGIHPPGSERASVDKLLKDFDLTFPICVDTPDSNGPGWGTLYARYHIYGIPCAFVVDRDGHVAAHGTLAECLAAAYKIAGG